MIGILGDGAMATAIAYILEENGNKIQYFSRKQENLSEIHTVETIFACVPSGVLISLHQNLQNVNLINCAKGIATEKNCFISSFFNKSCFATLSGPNFASEIIVGTKTITTLASQSKNLLLQAENFFDCNNVIIEKTQNVQGVELCGILKNAIAIIMGYASVKNPSWNERSLILTKLFQEMKVILHHFNCNEDVLTLSCGIGDIFLTCSTTNSRNFQLGVNLAQNLKTQKKTIEGVRSLQFLKTLNLPIPYFLESVNLLGQNLQ